jgi:hypothetical protein
MLLETSVKQILQLLYFCNTSWVDIWVCFDFLCLRLNGIWSIKLNDLQTVCGLPASRNIVLVVDFRGAMSYRWERRGMLTEFGGKIWMEEIAMKSRRWWEDNIKRCCKWMDLESVRRISATSAVAKWNSDFQNWTFLTIWASQQEQCSMPFGESFLREYKCWNRKTHCRITCLFVLGATVPSRPGPPHSRGFEFTPTTVGRTPLDEWSVRRINI